MLKKLIPLTLTALIGLAPLANAKRDFSAYFTTETSSRNLEIGVFYTPVTSEYFRLGIHGSIRREKSLPYLSGGTVGVGLGTEINPINLIVDERNPIYLTVGTKGQFYFTLPGEVDKDNDGTIDGPAEIGTIGLF